MLTNEFQPTNISGVHIEKGRKKVKGPVNEMSGVHVTRRLSANNALLSSGQSAIGGVKAKNLVRKGGRDTYLGSAPKRMNLDSSSNYFLGGAPGKIRQLGNITNHVMGLKKPSLLSLIPGLVYTATKATSSKIKRLAYGVVNPGLPQPEMFGRDDRRRISGPMTVTLVAPQFMSQLNDIALHKSLDNNNTMRSYSINQNAMAAISQYVHFASDPANKALLPEQSKMLYSLTRVRTEDGRALESASGAYNTVDLYRNIIQMMPNNIDKQTVMKIAEAAQKEKKKRDNFTKNRALQATADSFNRYAENMEALRRIAKETSGPAGTNLKTFIENNFSEEKKLTPEQVKAIEEEARKNVEARKDLTPEQVEEEYEKLKTELTKKKEEENMESATEMALKLIADDPNNAESILGEEGAKAYKEQMKKNEMKEQQMVAKNLMKDQMEKNKLYLQAHPEDAKLSHSELAKKVEEQEMRKDIQTSADKVLKRGKFTGKITRGDTAQLGLPQSSSSNSNNNSADRQTPKIPPKQTLQTNNVPTNNKNDNTTMTVNPLLYKAVQNQKNPNNKANANTRK